MCAAKMGDSRRGSRRWRPTRRRGLDPSSGQHPLLVCFDYGTLAWGVGGGGRGCRPWSSESRGIRYFFRPIGRSARVGPLAAALAAAAPAGGQDVRVRQRVGYLLTARMGSSLGERSPPPRFSPTRSPICAQVSRGGGGRVGGPGGERLSARAAAEKREKARPGGLCSIGLRVLVVVRVGTGGGSTTRTRGLHVLRGGPRVSR